MGNLTRLALLGATAAVLAPVAACWPNPSESSREDEMTQPSIEEVQEAHTAEWMTLPGVVGVGIGLCEGEPCIRVLLSRASPEAEEAIPERLDGYPVQLEVTGGFEPRVPGNP